MTSLLSVLVQPHLQMTMKMTMMMMMMMMIRIEVSNIVRTGTVYV